MLNNKELPANAYFTLINNIVVFSNVGVDEIVKITTLLINIIVIYPTLQKNIPHIKKGFFHLRGRFFPPNK